MLCLYICCCDFTDRCVPLHACCANLLTCPVPATIPPLPPTPLPSCSDPHLQFVEEVALPPPEVHIDLAEQQRNEQELAEAVNAPLPADDDDELID